MADDEAPELHVGMSEDIEDLKAKLEALTAQVEALTEDADADEGEAFTDEAAEAGREPGAGAEEESEEWQSPPFILLLDSPEYDDELHALIE
ncbi:hypothetical protein WDH52_22795 [Streptomyces sp. TRM70308]|uniref:hypothetical protein n=1 Tax=Streptomyces sp. TRM70308 TaxID=3131932 RepID=UPI003CFF05BB